MDTITMADGTRLPLWTEGARTDLPPVVLVHGGPGLWDDLGDLAALISDQTLVHRFDQRGCGRSTPRPVAAGQFTIERSVADLEELREALDARHGGHERWIVIGHSFGADLALAYAHAHPDHVAAVGYLDGTGIGDWRSAYRAERNRRRALAGIGDRLAELTAIAETRSREQEIEWRTLQWATDFADPADGLHAARILADVPIAIEHTANCVLAGDPRVSDAALREAVAGIDAPIWFAHGLADPRPVGPVVELSRLAPNGRRRVIEGGGHRPWHENPGRTREVLEEIVRSGR